MDNKEIFSVITVSFNQGKYIEETIKSVVLQKGNFFLEYLIVDGGSTDNTLETLERYKKLIENKKIEINCKGIDFKYISEKDEGPTNALNKGLRSVKGEVIGIINSDDIYPQDALKNVWETFKKNKLIDIVYGDVEFIDERGYFIGKKKGFKNLSEKNFFFENPLIQPEVFIRKRVIEKVGIFDEEFKYANDYEFWLRCLNKKLKFQYIPYSLAIFRKRPNARSASSNLFLFVETLKVQGKYFGKTKYFFKNLGIYSAMYTYEIKENFDSGFNKILKLLNKELPGNLNKRFIKKAKSIGYLKFSIYKIYENKKESLKNYCSAIINNPLIFFSKNNFIFLIRLFFMRKNVYFGIKSFFLNFKINKS